MAREKRVNLTGGLHQVIIRGNNGESIFRRNDDYLRMFDLLAEGVRRFGHRIHGFSCLTSEAIFVIEECGASVSDVMHNLCFRYAQWYNRKYGRKGHVFGQRFQSMVVETAKHLPDLMRHVHRSPVEAGLAQRPEEYRWSSHACYLGCEQLAWLTTDWVLAELDPDPERARQKLDELVNNETTPIPPEVSRGMPFDRRFLSSPEFAVALLRAKGLRIPRRLLELVEPPKPTTDRRAAGEDPVSAEKRAPPI